jgi:CRISPR-associated endonuclease/helicase Cas3
MDMTMSDSSFEDWFHKLTGHESPRPWQRELAETAICRDRLIRIPTGLGKTEGVLAAWSYHRLECSNDHWPRRLVWCLPMRVLVEQTAEVAQELADEISPQHRPSVHVAMGGEDAGEWFLSPECPAIIVGTQDMLLSRALNRGYASARARWPVEFGLLNHDALWVMDEVQLMDVGLATSAQLQAFREEDRDKQLRPCHTWWMSATLQPDWLCSVDTACCHENWISQPCIVAPGQQAGGLWDIQKSLEIDAIGQSDSDTMKFAGRIVAEHAKTPASEFGRITLAVCNTVERACRTYDAIRKAGFTGELELVHSRFRPEEREKWRERFLSRGACTSGADRIIVATQVVEAGVDISAGCLITELAPWPSLVQRFGRCARYGGSGRVLVVDRGRDETSALPYAPQELDSAWDACRQLTKPGVGIAALEAHEESLTPEAKKHLYPYSPSHLLLRREFDELFDTTPDLTGADLDISRFIRSGDERDLQVFWLEIAKDKKGERPKQPPKDRQPQRKELCSVPFSKAREWLCEKGKSKQKANKRAWVWDWIDGEWKPAAREALLPGRIVCVAADSGGYLIERGFDPESSHAVSILQPKKVDPAIEASNEADEQQDSEALSQISEWKTIACHGQEVAQEARKIASQLGLPEELQDVLELAALWHDWGKSHPAFQGAMNAPNGPKRPDRRDLAKGPEKAWRKPPDMYRQIDSGEVRPAFRHEFASALGLFAILQIYAPRHPALLGPWSEVFATLGKSPPQGDPPPQPSPLIERLLSCSAERFDLVAYLVASHHGKVRVGLHASPKDQEYRDRDGRGLPIRGVREGDRLPSIALIPGEPRLPDVVLSLSPAAVGLSDRTGISWRERCLGLLDRHGPAALALLEAVLRAADVRASKLKTNDPDLPTEAKA